MRQVADTCVMDRRRLLVNRRFQLIFLAFMCGSALGSCAVFYLGMAYLYTGVGGPIPLADLNGVMAWAAIFILCGMLVAGLAFSARVSRSMERVARHMRAVAEGKTHAELSPRRGDFFPEVTEAINAHLRNSRPQVIHRQAPAQGPARRANRKAA
ncbi:MAG TPA: hypothetical protein VL588_04375 [Bdellovibrionota bacterium]|nr:hypothetical protein [Bdellovibrionota bacterium]